MGDSYSDCFRMLKRSALTYIQTNPGLTDDVRSVLSIIHELCLAVQGTHIERRIARAGMALRGVNPGLFFDFIQKIGLGEILLRRIFNELWLDVSALVNNYESSFLPIIKHFRPYFEIFEKEVFDKTNVDEMHNHIDDTQM